MGFILGNEFRECHAGYAKSMPRDGVYGFFFY